MEVSGSYLEAVFYVFSSRIRVLIDPPPDSKTSMDDGGSVASSLTKPGGSRSRSWRNVWQSLSIQQQGPTSIQETCQAVQMV